jgi:MFS family permease
MDVLFLWIMIGYGMTSIIVWGSIFESTRDFIKKRSKFFGDLISCTLCTATWVGFFLSILLGGLTNYFYEIPWYICLFTDGMFTAGSVWMVNAIIEFFEESRIK